MDERATTAHLNDAVFHGVINLRLEVDDPHGIKVDDPHLPQPHEANTTQNRTKHVF